MNKSLEILIKCINQNEDLNDNGGRSPHAYHNVIDKELLSKIADEKNTKDELFELIKQDKESTPGICLKILSWGAMHSASLKTVFEDYKQAAWLKLAHKIRCGQYNRQDAYEEFAELRRNRLLVGMGPAYFTKLIFFLMPGNSNQPRGYIMDQWVASSVNLLAGQNIVLLDANYSWNKDVKLQNSFYVSDFNKSADYEKFCLQVEQIAYDIGKTPIDTERVLMSQGGRHKYAWRQYVLENRKVYP